MDKKVIDYLVVKSLYNSNEHYRLGLKERICILSIALEIKNCENEILMHENEKTLLAESKSYLEELLSTVLDFTTYKVSKEDNLFYQYKYRRDHPLGSRIEDNENFKIRLAEEIGCFEGYYTSINAKITDLKSKLHEHQVVKKGRIESDQTTDLETFNNDFENSVMHYIEKGYVPQGGISVSEFHYHQAMVKYEE